MIRKLQIRLIMASMLSLLIVLVVIIGIINGINYSGIVRDADSVLNILRQNGGEFPQYPAEAAWADAGPRFQSPELAFEARFFSVLMDGSGQIISTDVNKIAAVDSESVADYARNAYEQECSSGFSEQYRYVRYDEEEKIRIIFLDCGRVLAGFRSVLFNSIAISLGGLAAVFMLVFLLSGRIVKPVSESYKKQKRFITDAGHEIKTPLTIIDADAEILKMELGENEWLEDIRAQAKRLVALTDDLICMSRMEEPEGVHMIEFLVSDLVQEIAESFQSLAITQNKRFILDIQPMLSFCGDEKSFKQLVGILLDNAVKYSSEQGDISLSLEKTGKTLTLSVRNTADSISEDTLSSMFDRFYRGDPSRNSRKPGYGIGLSIAKAIVAMHRGKISASCEMGQVVRITAVFPG